VDDAVGPIFGTATPASETPCPPSSGVLPTMVPSTKVMASVSSAKSSPRTPLTRNTTAPRATPSSAATSPATGSVQRNGHS
jgi:hypothetical protein